MRSIGHHEAMAELVRQHDAGPCLLKGRRPLS